MADLSPAKLRRVLDAFQDEQAIRSSCGDFVLLAVQPYVGAKTIAKALEMGIIKAHPRGIDGWFKLSDGA